MCLSRSGVRSISGLSRALRMKGAMALTSCTSSSSTVGHLGEQQAPRVAVAKIDLLEILIQLALREELALRQQLFLKEPELRQLRRRWPTGAAPSWRERVGIQCL